MTLHSHPEACVSAPLRHDFAFDPTHGYGLERLLRVGPPADFPGFAGFWRERRERVRGFLPRVLHRRPVGQDAQGRRVFDLRYTTTSGLELGAWLVLPARGEPGRGLVVGHGYGVDGALDHDLPFASRAMLFPFFRGLGRSRTASIPAEVDHHVLHGIEHPETYVIGGCVEDLWISVALLESLHPELAGCIDYLGTSFGGGVGALALAWENRIRQAALVVPTFGHHALRLELPTVGSGASVQAYARAHPGLVGRTLAYYDAAIAARHVTIPVFCACARFDPAVAPAGQFSIYQALAGPKRLQVLGAGHFEHAGSAAEREILTRNLVDFFGGE